MRWARKGAKGAKMGLLRCYSRFLPRYSRFLPPSFPLSPPVIPAKAGIQTVAVRSAIRNQVRIAVIGSPLTLWAYRGRF